MPRRINRKVLRMWWDIKDVAFSGTNITRRNGMFMSSANKTPVGSVFKVKKNVVGVLTDNDLVFSYSTLREKFSDYPEIINDESAKPSASFTLDTSDETCIDVLASMIDSTNIADISTELSIILKNAKETEVILKQWGIDYIEEGEVALFLSVTAKSSDIRIKKILDSDNYIATRGIWIKGLAMKHKIDQEAIKKVKTILESKKSDLIKAKINLNIKSQQELDLNFKYDEKFYPFFKFRKIKHEKKGQYNLVASDALPENDVFLDDVDFSSYTA